MRDIAQKAGVSVVTVSRALNKKPDINSETREQILSIAREFDYRPDGLARSMVTRRTRTLGMVIPDMEPFCASIVDGVSSEALKRGYSVMLCNRQDSADKELELIRLLREKRVDGMLIYPLQADHRYIDELKNSPVPYVLLNRHAGELACDYVISNNVEGAYTATRHLLERGRRGLVYVCPEPRPSSGRERIAGCVKAMDEFGLPRESLRVAVCRDHIGSCYDVTKDLLKEDNTIDAIFTWDDRLAFGAIKAISDAGLRIPGDVALVGYDDVESSAYLTPPLTTVRNPSREIGQTAVRVLLDRLELKEEKEPERIVLKPELIVRESS
jgi:LacI family transcriptional regulator